MREIDNVYARARRVAELALDEDTYAHSVRVASIVWGEGLSIPGLVALLHDVVEDSAWTLGDLERLGEFDEVVLDAVDLLTRRPPYDYDSYIDRICDSEDEIAIRVKLADIQDHLEFGDCGATLRSRYEKAREKLNRAMAFLHSN